MRSQLFDVSFIRADYSNPKHASDLAVLLNAYAMDPMGGEKPLDKTVLDSLPKDLASIPGAFSVLAYRGAEAIGIANCFEGFSTFRGEPLINIHDIFVLKRYRSKGIAFLLLEKVEDIAKQRSCCKLTLEVLDKNHAARKLYKSFGFQHDTLTATRTHAHFLEKNINGNQGS